MMAVGAILFGSTQLMLQLLQSRRADIFPASTVCGRFVDGPDAIGQLAFSIGHAALRSIALSLQSTSRPPWMRLPTNILR
jgi:hypothetical protein